MTTPSPHPGATIRKAPLEERPLIEGLFQFYMYDWSELDPASSASFELDAAGRFAAYPSLADYWTKPGYWPGIIEVGGRVAGFLLINDQSHRGGVVEHNMAEFFVLRKHRRSAVASTVFWRTLQLFPGRWEVAVAERNVAAKAFWSRAIASAPSAKDVEIVEGDDAHWRGPIWCFNT